MTHQEVVLDIIAHYANRMAMDWQDQHIALLELMARSKTRVQLEDDLFKWAMNNANRSSRIDAILDYYDAKMNVNMVLITDQMTVAHLNQMLSGGDPNRLIRYKQMNGKMVVRTAQRLQSMLGFNNKSI